MLENPMNPEIEITALRQELLSLQDKICDALESQDGSERFLEDIAEPPGGGLSRPRVLANGPVVEKAAVNYSHTVGAALPAAATARRPELAGASFEAVSISLIVHPRNPYAPTTHANLRAFAAKPPDGPTAWWLGGGFDLTPFYPFTEDAVHWHRVARDACSPYGEGAYTRFKTWCDEYFYLPHRGEARGVGGLFFDDLDSPDFATCHALWSSVGAHFLLAYLPILERRKDTPYGDRERTFQLLRRGRYAEFNLLYDRGTRFGLERMARSGGRVEAILASLPPVVRWDYAFAPPEPGSPEARLADFLRPREWLEEGPPQPDGSR